MSASTLQLYVDLLEDEIKAIASAALAEWVETPTPWETFESLVASGVAAAVQSFLLVERNGAGEVEASHLANMANNSPFPSHEMLTREVIKWKHASREILQAMDGLITQSVDCPPEIVAARNRVADLFQKDARYKKALVYKNLEDVFGITVKYLDGEELSEDQHAFIGITLVSTALHLVSGFLMDPPQPVGSCLCLACRGNRATQRGIGKISELFTKAMEVYGSYQTMLVKLGEAYTADLRDSVAKEDHNRVDPEVAKDEASSLIERLLNPPSQS